MPHTIAHRIAITFDEASTIADDCVGRKGVEHRQHTVRLLDEGRLVAADARKVIVSKRQLAAGAKASRKAAPRKTGIS
jgi:hypothetical protein